MVDFETEKYKFWFYQQKEAVFVGIATMERRNFTDEDVSELKEFFEDMGKWEVFVKAGKSLLEDLGISTKSQKEHEREFGFEKYEITEFKKEDNRVVVTLILTREESLRRTRGDTARDILSIEEVLQQIKNVPKWQALKKAMLELKRHL